MRQLTDGVWQLSGRPANNVNIYLLGDVLIDAGMIFDKGRILAQVANHAVTAHALTHGHIDHYGASHAVCTELGIPLWCGAADREAVESGKMVTRYAPGKLPAAPAHPVARSLAEGDTVADFTVLDTPGHSPGHVSFWRESDRTLVCGDVMFGYNPFLLSGGIREPIRAFSVDPERNRESARRIAALEPELTCFGHGPPLHGPDALRAAVDALR